MTLGIRSEFTKENCNKEWLLQRLRVGGTRNASLFIRMSLVFAALGICMAGSSTEQGRLCVVPTTEWAAVLRLNRHAPWDATGQMSR